MFTDLVGSTALSTKLDPEDMRSVIGVYPKCVAETVARFDGFVAKYVVSGPLPPSCCQRADLQHANHLAKIGSRTWSTI